LAPPVSTNQLSVIDPSPAPSQKIPHPWARPIRQREIRTSPEAGSEMQWRFAPTRLQLSTIKRPQLVIRSPAANTDQRVRRETE
jgi:hypothetical protein